MLQTIKSRLRELSEDVDAPGWDEMTGFGMIGGKNADPCVCMNTNTGFFGRIFKKMQSFFGFDNKESKNGEIV